MTIGLTDSANYQAIADAIRSKNGNTETYSPDEMAEAINNIPTNEPMETLENQAGAEHISVGYAAYNAEGEVITGIAETVTDELVREAIDDYFVENPIATGATQEQVSQIQSNTAAIAVLSSPVTHIDFSNFDNGSDVGSFTETVNGEVITHYVTFETIDGTRRPTAIDNCVIVWGDA